MGRDVLGNEELEELGLTDMGGGENRTCIRDNVEVFW